MQCPKCHAKIIFAQMARHNCPSCGAKIYFSPKWRWLRGISCGLVVILLNYQWYPTEGSFGRHLIWLVTLGIVFLLLLFGSIRLLPPEIDLVPEICHLPLASEICALAVPASLPLSFRLPHPS